MQDILEVTKYEADQIFQVGPRSSSLFSVFLSRKFVEIILNTKIVSPKNRAQAQMHEGGRRNKKKRENQKVRDSRQQSP